MKATVVEEAAASGVTTKVAAPARDIPSLDGLRAICILSVLLAHSVWLLPALVAGSSVFRFVVGSGKHGVAVFFVISGYLITTLLLRESEKNGSVSLRRFYIRRTLRIFPPYYVFLAFVGILWMRHLVFVDWDSYLTALSYTWSLNPHASAPVLLHTWSLSIEEIFYLAWPLMLIAAPGKAMRRTVGMIVLFPLLRLALYFVAPDLRGHEFYMVQGWADTILAGCLLALLRRHKQFEAWQTRHLKGWIVGLLFVLAFYVSPLLIEILPKTAAGFYVQAVNPTLVAFVSAAILLYVITRTGSVVAIVLNNPVLKHIGVLSYSLYLWQQFFMSHQAHVFWMGYVYAFLCAELSYRLIERPSLRLRRMLEGSEPSELVRARQV